MYSKEELANDFRKLDVRAADTVRLQASVRAAGKVAGGPDYIHLALKMENGCRVWRAIEEFDTSATAFMRPGQIVFSRRSSTVFSPRRGTTAPEWEKP